MKKILLACLLLSLLIATKAQAEEVQYISSAKAKVMATPEFRGEVLAELDRGAEIRVVSQQGPWLEIQLQEGNAWVSRMLASSSPPMERVSVLGANEESNLRDVRRRTSAITTAAAARGLASSQRQQTGEGGHPSDYQAVELMESILIDPEELEAFSQPLQGVAP